MKVRDLINMLLDCDLNKEVSLQYPTDKYKFFNNYSRYEETEQFKIHEYDYNVIIGVEK